MKHGSPENPRTCAKVAEAIGIDCKSLRHWLGVRSSRSLVSREDIRDALEWYGLDADLSAHEIAIARFAGPRFGEYVELDWLRPPDWPWKARHVRPPRIFAEPTPRDKGAESDTRDLIRLHLQPQRGQSQDRTLRRAAAAVEMALRSMRSRERAVLLTRMQARRGSPDTTWASVVTASDLDSVSLTKEVFKVAVQEFLREYARISQLLIKDPDYTNGL